MSYWLSTLPTVLRRAGLYVVEVPGWQTRSYPTWTPPGYLEKPTHIMVHHTASNTTAANDVNYILHGPISPICNIYLARNGVCHVIAAGRTATNGKGSSAPWHGGVPDDTMNHYAISIEAANDGKGEPWPKEQTTAYVQLCAALAVAYQIPVAHIRGHCEWAPGRKIDPAGPSPWALTGTWNMDQFRHSVQEQLSHTITLGDNMRLLNPSQRIYDSRSTNQILEPNKEYQILVPTSDPAALLNICAVGATNPGYLTVWGGAGKPATSAVNYQTGQAIANCIPVQVVNGHVTVVASSKVHVIIDLYATWPAGV